MLVGKNSFYHKWKELEMLVIVWIYSEAICVHKISNIWILFGQKVQVSFCYLLQNFMPISSETGHGRLWAVWSKECFVLEAWANTYKSLSLWKGPLCNFYISFIWANVQSTIEFRWISVAINCKTFALLKRSKWQILLGLLIGV